MRTEQYRPGLGKNQGLVEKLREFQRNPRSLVFVSLAESYRTEGLASQALEILEEGLAHHAGLASAVVAKARCLFDLKRYAEALSETQLALRNNDQNLKAHKLQAEIYVRLGQRKAAIRALTRVVTLYPQDGEAVRALEELESFEQARAVPAAAAMPRASVDTPPAALGRIEDFQVGSLSGSLAEVMAAASKAAPRPAPARETLPNGARNEIVLPTPPPERKRAESLHKKARALERMLAAARLMKPMGA